MRVSFYIFTIIITAMIGYTLFNGEALVAENGRVEANVLPLDKETSQIAYQTATFGIG